MSVSNFDELEFHSGHEIEVNLYGTDDEAINAAIECITCGTVLLDFDKYPEEEPKVSNVAVLCGTNDRNGAIPEVYGPFQSIDEANDFLVPHRSECDATDQAWRDNPDNADEGHDIVEMVDNLDRERAWTSQSI